ncbi:MAG: SEL1-like repeat protein [Variovorax sp.]
MSMLNSPWLAAHGKLWYDDKPYRIAWIVWPQALAAALLLWFWFAPSSVSTKAQWAKPMDQAARVQQLATLRDNAKSSQQAMDALERAASGGEAMAQFYYATLFDPNFKLSTIVAPDENKAIGWYQRSATQGNQLSIGNLALGYYFGQLGRKDNTRACYYARTITKDAGANALRVKGDCYAQGLGGTQVDMTAAAAAYELSSTGGNSHATAALGYFYENGVGGRPKSPETALKYYRFAADKGDALGLHNLGYAYNAGLLGLQRDANESSRLIMQALDGKYEVTVQSLTNRPEYWTGEFWQSLQRRLAERGLYSGPADGRPNSATLDAVRRLGRRQ